MRRPGLRKLALIACFLAFGLVGGVTGARQRVDAALARGDFDRARTIQDRLAWLRLDAAAQRYALAHALTEAKQFDAATPQFERALALSPDGDEWASLAAVHVLRGDAEAAIHAWERGFEASRDPRHLQRASELLVLHGEPERAFAHLERALSIDPPSALIHARIAEQARTLGLTQHEIEHLRAALAFDPERRSLREQLAWRLATSAPLAPGDREDAVRLAEDLVQETGRRDARLLDTLAAALASLGRYDAAVLVAAEADDLASRRADFALADAIRERLALYRDGRAFVENPADARS